MQASKSEQNEYSIVIRTGDIHEAVSETANALYGLVEEALTHHENHECEECEFEAFARDVLGVLTRHGDKLSSNGNRDAVGIAEHNCSNV